MRSLKAQLMGMVSGKSQNPPDSTILPDSATFAHQLLRAHHLVRTAHHLMRTAHQLLHRDLPGAHQGALDT